MGPIVDLPTAIQYAKAEMIDGAVLNLIIAGQHAYSVAEILAHRNIPTGTGYFGVEVERGGKQTGKSEPLANSGLM